MNRGSRTLALLAGIVVAVTSFAVLTGTSESQRLDVRGTVARSFRGDYDILVRPRGSRSPLERRGGQVQPNFLSGIFGGISTRQWRAIERLPGVEVAAPIANLGYVLPSARVPVRLSRAAIGSHRALLRARVSFSSEDGLTRTPDTPMYAYVTPNPLRDPPYKDGQPLYTLASLREEVPGRSRPLRVCNELPAGGGNQDVAWMGPFTQQFRTGLTCVSTGNGMGEFDGDYLWRMAPEVDLRQHGCAAPRSSRYSPTSEPVLSSPPASRARRSSPPRRRSAASARSPSATWSRRRGWPCR